MRNYCPVIFTERMRKAYKTTILAELSEGSWDHTNHIQLHIFLGGFREKCDALDMISVLQEALYKEKKYLNC